MKVKNILFLLCLCPVIANAEISNYEYKKIIKHIKNEYVKKFSEKELNEKAIGGLIKELDPHSSFLNKKDFQNMKIKTNGQFGGLGIEVTMEKGLVKVVSPIDDTPAFRAGVKSGDYITSIDGKPILGMTLDDAVSKMRGKPGTKINLSIIRESEKEPLNINIIREIIKISSVKYELKKDNILYIRISSFSSNTTSSIIEALKKANNKLNGIILDMRNNPGGLLDQSISVSDLFLQKNSVIVSTKSRNEERNFVAQNNSSFPNTPIVVLINSGSASASEIVAGALQDNKRAIIIGTKSFGKGSVQSIIPISSDKAIRITTAHYYTPSGNSIQAKGIIPDIIIPTAEIKFKEKDEAYEADLEGHLLNPDLSEDNRDEINNKLKIQEITKRYKDDYLLSRAIDIINTLNINAKINNR